MENKIAPINKELREKILDIEESISKMDGALYADAFPLKHSFGKGLYIREINMPKGSLVVSKIHKYEHPYFILKGDISVLTEGGEKRIIAPYYGITPAVTKRLLYCHTDAVWVTVHATEETEVAKIEEEIIAKDFDELVPDYIKNAVEEGRKK